MTSTILKDIIMANDWTRLAQWLETGGNPNYRIDLDGWREHSLLYHVIDEIDEAEQDEDIIGMVSLLLAKGADVNADAPCHRTALFSAVREQKPKLVKILLEAGADVNVRTDEGDTPLSEATIKKDLETLELLLQYADAQCINTWASFYASTPLGIAFYKKDFELMELLLRYGADPYAYDIDNGQAIHCFKSEDEEELKKFRELLDKYA